MNRDPIEYGTCPVCGDLSAPVLELSPCGHPGEPARAPLDAVGTVYSWTRSWSSETDSTLIAMADFLDGRLRVAAPVLDAAEVRVGDQVRAVTGQDTPFVLVPVTPA